jgi:hypothetical protein
MYMSCNTGNLTRRKKIILFSSLSIGVGIITYLVFTTINNPAVAAAIPTVLILGACPLMCAAMGGAMWFSQRLSKNKNKNISERLQRSAPDWGQESSCCGTSTESKEGQEKPKRSLTPPSNQQKSIYEN